MKHPSDYLNAFSRLTLYLAIKFWHMCAVQQHVMHVNILMPCSAKHICFVKRCLSNACHCIICIIIFFYYYNNLLNLTGEEREQEKRGEGLINILTDKETRKTKTENHSNHPVSAINNIFCVHVFVRVHVSKQACHTV